MIRRVLRSRMALPSGILLLCAAVAMLLALDSFATNAVEAAPKPPEHSNSPKKPTSTVTSYPTSAPTAGAPPATTTPTATKAATSTAVPPSPTPSSTADLALNRPVTASSMETSSYPAGAAVDGDGSTRWSSQRSDPQWIHIDLGGTHQVSRVKLTWEAAYAKAYELQLSNDATNWTTIYSTTSGTGGTNDLSVNGNGRYVRMHGTVRGTVYGYSLWGFEVYSGSGTPPTSTRSPATATATPVPPTKTAAPTSTPVPPTKTAAPTSPPAPTLTSTPMPTSTPAPKPPSGPIYWGAWVPGVPWDMAKQAQFEGWAQKGASIIHWGQAWKKNGVYQPFYPNDFERARTHGSIPMLDWGSWNLGGTDQSEFRLANIAAGAHDAHLRNWATGAKNWGKPLFLRFDWEMNGGWFPWGEQTNGNQPGDFVRAWRHVHDIFTSVGATNVKWVWCPNIVGGNLTPIASLYPGDAYVDWVAMDGYNWAADRNSPWLTFSQVINPTYDALISLAPSKPIMIGETGTSEDGGPLGKPNSKAAWITDALAQLPANFPRIKALVWFNWNDNDPALDWPIETSQASIDAFARGISSSYYAANNYATLSTLP